MTATLHSVGDLRVGSRFRLSGTWHTVAVIKADRIYRQSVLVTTTDGRMFLLGATATLRHVEHPEAAR